MEKAMKINHKFFTPPHIIFTLFLTLSLLTGCMTGDDSKTTEYKLSFSANGGTGEMESIIKEENEKINLPADKRKRKCTGTDGTVNCGKMQNKIPQFK